MKSTWNNYLAKHDKYIDFQVDKNNFRSSCAERTNWGFDRDSPEQRLQPPLVVTYFFFQVVVLD